MVWPLKLTRVVHTKATVKASRDHALKFVQDLPSSTSLSPLCVSCREGESKDVHYVTERLNFLGWKFHMTFPVYSTNTEDGVDLVIKAGAGTTLRTHWSVSPTVLELGSEVCEISELVEADTYFFFVPYVLHNLKKSRHAIFPNLVAELEGAHARDASHMDDRDEYHPTERIAKFVLILTACILPVYILPVTGPAYTLAALFVMGSSFAMYSKARDPYGTFHITLNVRPGDGQNPPDTEWLNMGYWVDTDIFSEACEALATRLMEAARLKAGDRVLDVGFGSGDSLLFILSSPKIPRPSSVTGITSLRSHYERALARTRKLNIDTPVLLLCGDAVYHAPAGAHPFHPSASPSFDVILALDCAYHFRTRREFLQQSFEHLAPGGRVALADICFTPESLGGRRVRLFTRLLGMMPRQNVISTQEYVQALKEMGYGDVCMEDVSEKVFPGFTRFLRCRGGGWWAFSSLLGRYYALGARFVIVVGTKPKTAGSG
ncbi:S-adenosyl-L-methionine-dependent methyltransferase [Punctularia strigosozonata HHB-11173 SS5]|uniref:S-adenosyl-L-methionine-dependent methyltransferase n=1 Tax=Punctularia strigosozonata (strain HHB-11173) TaxID=741275 RepID=UPI0004417C27|nr:S-adenosyl-L-methionine-dependent methyltransferase [Punctularia strigosozonata HHB-11173 SS5]EIN13682.1 S-adenosyl-L-methionine-dependent methyltransferase [Punctularia strigosozonata HHB-11173 SS5]